MKLILLAFLISSHPSFASKAAEVEKIATINSSSSMHNFRNTISAPVTVNF